MPQLGDYIFQGLSGGAQALASGATQGARLKTMQDIASQRTQALKEIAGQEQAVMQKRLGIEQQRADAYTNWMDHQRFMGEFDRGWDMLPHWMGQRLQAAPAPAEPSHAAASPSVMPPQPHVPGKFKQMGADASALMGMPSRTDDAY